MPKIYFTSGKVEDLEVNEEDFGRMVLKMQTSGMKLLRLKNGSLVPLNSNTIEIVTCDDFKKLVPEVVVVPIASTEAVCIVKEEPVEESKPIESASTTYDKEKKALAIIIEKSNCRHEPEKLTLTKIDGKKGCRYFYVCSFCGWRGRYVKAETLKVEDKEAAKTYSEK